MEEAHPFKRIVQAIKRCFRKRFPATEVPAAPAIPPLPEDDLELDEQLRAFPGEMFARLLIELPEHRSSIAQAFDTGDMDSLRNNVHQLLGGAAYCNAPELTTGLRELRLALKTGNQETIGYYYQRAMDVIDSTLRYSGYRG